MHTVRNRIASRPPTNKVALADFKPPVSRTSRQELSLIARGSALPEGPASESPGRTCSMAPERTVESRPQKRRNAKGKKARKAAARKAAAAANPALHAKAQESKGRGGKRRHGGPAAPPPVHPPAHPLADLEPSAMRDLCLQAEPALALLLPSRPEPLVEAPAPAAPPDRELAPEQATRPAAAQLPVPTLPDLPEPLAELAVLAPAAALTALADAQTVPLPRSRALVPARRQGLVDVIAFLLRDSGRRLARWSARRHKTRAEQAALRQAEARQLNRQRELEALAALRRNRG